MCVVDGCSVGKQLFAYNVVCTPTSHVLHDVKPPFKPQAHATQLPTLKSVAGVGPLPPIWQPFKGKQFLSDGPQMQSPVEFCGMMGQLIPRSVKSLQLDV